MAREWVAFEEKNYEVYKSEIVIVALVSRPRSSCFTDKTTFRFTLLFFPVYLNANAAVFSAFVRNIS